MSEKVTADKYYPLHILEALRGLAALYVMIGHAKWLLWEGYYEGFAKHPEQYSFAEKILVQLLSLFKYGHQMVLFFFVLSGFVIHLKYARNISIDNNARFNLKEFVIKRARRIYPPFILSIFLTFLLDSIGRNLHFTIYNSATPYMTINTVITKQYDLINLVGNLCFIQNEHIGVWGTNGPSWSLKYEWWFYMLYTGLVYVNARSVIGSLLLVIGLFVLGFTGPHIMNGTIFFASVLKYLSIWWLGVSLADIYTGRISIRYSYVALLLLLGPLLVIAEIKNISFGYFFYDFLWGLFFLGLFGLIFKIQSKNYFFDRLKKLDWLGNFSYTLYITHFPILVFLNGIVLHYTNNVMPKSFVFVFIGIAITVITAYLLHFLVERPFVRKKRQ